MALVAAVRCIGLTLTRTLTLALALTTPLTLTLTLTLILILTLPRCAASVSACCSGGAKVTTRRPLQVSPSTTNIKG